MSKENFKEFVKNNPNLVDYVKNNEMTWQKFYEIYDLYGENSEVWKNYLNNDSNKTFDSFRNIFDLFKGIDLKTVQKTLTGLDKAINTFRDFGSNNDNNITNIYETRPTERYYED